MDPRISQLQDQVNYLTQRLDALNSSYQLHAHTGADQTQTIHSNTNVNTTTLVSSATPTINVQAGYGGVITRNFLTITALAANITSMTSGLTGRPNNFDTLVIRILDNGTARTITWGASFVAKGVSLPTTTTISKLLTVGFIYDSVLNTWGCVASAIEA